jgi:CheY-like chemotaxis protein/anti-sigma regulatory factor (Ser/Thr protein kinase)
MAQAMARGELTPDQRERLDVIQAAGKALLTVLNDVLDISKIESGAIELEDGVVDFEEIAATARSTFSSLARDKGLRLTAAVDPEACGLWRGDPARLRQILHNLVGNAVKFTDAGSISIGVSCDGDRVVMSVTDTGPGIAPERQGHIFDRFAQADASTTRRYGGTGLGLAICRELASLMGGQISVRSALGEGAAFSVRLPLQRIEYAATPGPEPAAPEPTQAQLRILAAEDNATNQLVLQTLLSQFGLEAHIVENGEAAVAAWETGDWDVVLMDVQMPVMDGPTATRLIRERERRGGLGRTPILALTANAMSHHAEEYRRAGMDGLVPKPINAGELIKAIQAAIADSSEEAPPFRQAKAG